MKFWIHILFIVIQLHQYSYGIKLYSIDQKYLPNREDYLKKIEEEKHFLDGIHFKNKKTTAPFRLSKNLMWVPEKIDLLDKTGKIKLKIFQAIPTYSIPCIAGHNPIKIPFYENSKKNFFEDETDEFLEDE